MNPKLASELVQLSALRPPGPPPVRRSERARGSQGGDRTRESLIPCRRCRQAPAEARGGSVAASRFGVGPDTLSAQCDRAHTACPLQFVPFLAQRLGQARAQIV